MADRLNVLIAAGNTRERIDDVRQWSNIFTGRTGLDIALKMLDVADVTLLTSNLEHAKYFSEVRGKTGVLNTIGFNTHAELMATIAKCLGESKFHGVFMSAAISDYIPAGAFRIISSTPISGSNPPQENWVVESVQAAKISGSYPEIAIRGMATEKIIDMFRARWNYSGLLYKFKLQAGISEEELVAIAQKSRGESGADVIVANTLQMVRGDDPGAWIIDNAASRRVSRRQLAQILVDDFLNRVRQNQGAGQ
ncbi:MAG TPA: phosphopantothenoylcysteine decarboxylase [Phycisphaerae bacterium]|nr:phosphopantothenoylcysteine decarboxylase [Phycisphaerae bacterium]